MAGQNIGNIASHKSYLVPTHTALHLQDVQLNFGLAGGVLAEEGVGLNKVNVVLLGHTHIQNTL